MVCVCVIIREPRRDACVQLASQEQKKNETPSDILPIRCYTQTHIQRGLILLPSSSITPAIIKSCFTDHFVAV